MNREELLGEIRAERERQITEEGWSDNHDDSQYLGGLGQAGAALAYCGRSCDTRENAQGRALWPFEDDTWKPHDLRNNLIRSSALILAELERLERFADTITFFTVGEDSEIYAADSRETLIRLLEYRGVLKDVSEKDIHEIDGQTLVWIDERRTRKGTLRAVFMDTFGTVSWPHAEQIISAYT